VYPIEPPGVWVHESAMADERCRVRVERFLAGLRRPTRLKIYRDSDLPAMVEDEGLLDGRKPMGTLPEVRDPTIVFNTFRFDGQFAARRAALAERIPNFNERGFPAFLGYGAFHWANYNLQGDPNRHDKVCRPCWRIHLQNGCVHRCKYCALGGTLVAALNVEDYCHHLGRLIVRHPWQLTYLLDDDGDPPCLEPELGVLPHLIEFFGSLEDRYLVVHTKTWNTAWMRDLDHRGKTIIVWSISAPTQSRLLEPGTGTTEERVEAARVAQEAGYQIRYKFKPIIPVRGWREEAAYAIRLLFEKTRPDVISLCCFMWMDVDEMLRRLPEELLDPHFVQAAREGREEVRDTVAKPFPHRVREEIYDHYLSEIRRWDPDIPVSLSTENFAMWKAFGHKVGFSATDYVCGCGPQTIPGARRLECHPFQVAVRNDEGIPGTF